MRPSRAAEAAAQAHAGGIDAQEVQAALDSAGPESAGPIRPASARADDSSNGTAACPLLSAAARIAMSRTYSWIMKLRSCRHSIHSAAELIQPRRSARARLSIAGPMGSASQASTPGNSLSLAGEGCRELSQCDALLPRGANERRLFGLRIGDQNVDLAFADRHLKSGAGTQRQ